MTFSLPCDPAMYYCWLMPYVASNCVSVEEIHEALSSGLDVMEIHTRLLNAECELFGGKRIASNHEKQACYAKYLKGKN